MDTPLRVTPLSSRSLTTKGTQKGLELFLQDLQDRTTAAQGGQTTVTVQLEKLAKALKEEREEMNAVAGAYEFTRDAKGIMTNMNETEVLPSFCANSGSSDAEGKGNEPLPGEDHRAGRCDVSAPLPFPK
ncbi:hypothetical protein HMN09_01076600 [Mycena chlorophos]|uniref:Uncharacterized protein n=1 Tax=Mycena chlorophos TaxID=658473 RepID=A0A8H6SD06_MYCCL|nr:hypothetical protein HMN09_01076600 [Mycena chlorophos]